MILSQVLLATALLVGGHAQQITNTASTELVPLPPSRTTNINHPSPTYSKIHYIHIGKDGPWDVQPNRTDARVGDTIEWRFYSGEHWIIRGILDAPCIPAEYIIEDMPELSSGPMKVDEKSDEVLKFSAKINSTDTILFYSGAERACVDHEMMGVINPTRNVNLINYKSRAKDVEFQLRPGEPWPEDGELPSKTAPNVPTATTTGKAAEETSSPPAEDNVSPDGGGGGLSASAIAGLAVGGTLALVILGLAIFYCGRRGGVKILFTKEQSDSSHQGQYPRYATPATVGAPFLPPRTPHMEDWRGARDHEGNILTAAQSPGFSPDGQHTPVTSPYRTGEGASRPSGVPVASPRAQYENKHISSYYDPHYVAPGSGGPLWSDVSHDRASATPAVELPTSSDPGNSPLPQHQSKDVRPQQRKWSWSGTEESALFRQLYI